MQVIVDEIKSLDKQIYNQLCSLNAGPSGYMAEVLEFAVNNRMFAKAAVIIDEANVVLGWGCVSQCSPSLLNTKYLGQVYVNYNFRGKGIGTKIIRHLEKIAQEDKKTLHFCANDTNDWFFEKVNAKNIHYHYWKDDRLGITYFNFS